MGKKIVLIALICILLIGAIFVYYGFHNSLAVVVYGTVSAPATPPEPPRPTVMIGGTKIFVAEATTTAEILQGLSGTPSLAPSNGMLFIFATSQKYRFWMPDMNFSLDMIWIGADKKIVDINKNVPPLKDKTKPVFYSPRVPAEYVLEVNAGFSDSHHIATGTFVQFKSL